VKIYKDRHVNKKLIVGKKVLILGYGNQGRAQALALRKSGAKVEIHLPPKSHSTKQAKRDGFLLRKLMEAVPQADYVAFLTPDEWMPEIFEEVKPHLKPGQALVFAHALAIHFNLIKIPNGIDTNLFAPHAAQNLAAARRLFFIRQQSAGILRKRRSSAQRNMPPGKRSSAVTQSRMAAMSRSQTASAMKRLREAMVLNFGDKVLFADQTAKSLQKVLSTKKTL